MMSNRCETTEMEKANPIGGASMAQSIAKILAMIINEHAKIYGFMRGDISKR
jgi:hypothetical protein